MAEVLAETTDYPVRSLLPHTAAPSSGYKEQGECITCNGHLCCNYSGQLGRLPKDLNEAARVRGPILTKLMSRSLELFRKLGRHYNNPFGPTVTLSPPIYDVNYLVMPNGPSSTPGIGQTYEHRPWCPICMVQFHPYKVLEHIQSFVHQHLVKSTPRGLQERNTAAVALYFLARGITGTAL